MKNFKKYLLLVLAFLSIGVGPVYGNTLPEIREDLPHSSANFQTASFSLFCFRENPFQEISDLSKNQFFPNHSVIPIKFSAAAATSEAKILFYKRDIRSDISKQIFPKHFFL